MTRYAIAIAACTAELSGVPSEILLIPAGVFRARDGRPQGLDGWKLDGEAAARIIAQAQKARGDFVIDYEHQTLHAEQNGMPAPAAGWFKRLEWRQDSGLWAVDVRWTEKARAAIAAGEYRYISPVFTYDPGTGQVTAILMAALTNYPAVDGLSDLQALAAAKFDRQPHQEAPMHAIAQALGLAEAAGERQILDAIAALKAKADQLKQTETELVALRTQVAELEQQSLPDPAKYVPVETFEALKGEVAQLRAQQVEQEVAALVEAGLKDGKLLPAQKDWATELGKKDIAALKAYLDQTPAIAALTGTQTGGKPPAGDGGTETIDDEALAVCRNLGIDPAEYRKHLETEE